MKTKQNKDALAYNFIKNNILNGTFPPNHFIDEYELSKELNISRTPIKNAFKILEKEQFVIIKSKKGTYVSPLNLKLIKDLFQIRSTFEYTLIELTLNNLGEKAVREKMLEFKKEFESLKEHSGFNDVYNRFRFFFAQNCGNVFMTNFMMLIYEHLYRLRVTIFKTTPRRLMAIDEQIQVIEYILEFGTSIRLKELVNTHIKKAQSKFFENLDLMNL